MPTLYGIGPDGKSVPVRLDADGKLIVSGGGSGGGGDASAANQTAQIALETAISTKLGSAAVTRGGGVMDSNTQRVTLATDGPGVAALTSIDGIYAEIIDQPDAATTYICQAAVGTTAATAAWRCRKIVVSGTTTTTTWAGGGAFTQVAANRASLTYA